MGITKQNSFSSSYNSAVGLGNSGLGAPPAGAHAHHRKARQARFIRGSVVVGFAVMLVGYVIYVRHNLRRAAMEERQQEEERAGLKEEVEELQESLRHIEDRSLQRAGDRQYPRGSFLATSRAGRRALPIPLDPRELAARAGDWNVLNQAAYSKAHLRGEHNPHQNAALVDVEIKQDPQQHELNGIDHNLRLNTARGAALRGGTHSETDGSGSQVDDDEGSAVATTKRDDVDNSAGRDYRYGQGEDDLEAQLKSKSASKSKSKSLRGDQSKSKSKSKPGGSADSEETDADSGSGDENLPDWMRIHAQQLPDHNDNGNRKPTQHGVQDAQNQDSDDGLSSDDSDNGSEERLD